MKKLSRIFIVCMVFASVTRGGDVTQWRGANRDGVYDEVELMNEWPAEGPQLLWSVDDIGNGYSSPSIVQGRVYITGMLKDMGIIFAFDDAGNLLWKTTYGKEWTGNYPGARTTPTVIDGRIYLMSGRGRVVCLGVQDGELIWQVDLVKAYGARNIDWGMTESLLVFDDKVICTPGGSKTTVVALNRLDGTPVWQSKSMGESSSYCSPQLVVHGGRRIIVTMTARSIIGLDAETGEILWRTPHVTEYDVNANTPIYHDGRIFCFSGYGTGGVMLELSSDGNQITRVWKDGTLDSQMGGAVLLDGHLYGSGQNNRAWHCIEWETGEVKYSSRAVRRKGSIIYADGMLYVYSEGGDIVLVKQDPVVFDIVSMFEVPLGSGEHWAHPVIANGRLYIRHGNALMVYDISEASI